MIVEPRNHVDFGDTDNRPIYLIAFMANNDPDIIIEWGNGR